MASWFKYWLPKKTAKMKTAGFSIPLVGKKGLGVEVFKDEHRTEHAPLDFNFEITRKCDHAGLSFDASILGFGVEVEITDGRHWNGRKRRWYEQDEEQGEMEHSNALRMEIYNWALDADRESLLRVVLNKLRSLPINGVADFHEWVFETDETESAPN